MDIIFMMDFQFRMMLKYLRMNLIYLLRPSLVRSYSHVVLIVTISTSMIQEIDKYHVYFVFAPMIQKMLEDLVRKKLNKLRKKELMDRWFMRTDQIFI